MEGLELSTGLSAALNEIENLEKQNKNKEATDKTKAALNQIRISGAILRCKLAEQCGKDGDRESARGLYKKAIEHLYNDNRTERRIIDAIKRKMNNT